MKIRYVTGDLVESDQILLAHGCNTKGRYSAGIAGTIRERMPFAYNAYRLAFEDHKADFKLGSVIVAIDIGNSIRPRIVANMLIQEDYGRDPEQVYVDYDAINMAMHKLNEFVLATQDGGFDVSEIGPITEVGFPLLGCGLGNGKWPVVSAIIEQKSRCFQPIVYTLNGQIPT
jgi:O-acetyl-ADP-ribose deacetylase (regulator of RNase III)